MNEKVTRGLQAKHADHDAGLKMVWRLKFGCGDPTSINLYLCFSTVAGDEWSRGP
ncbi:hypothetical protein [Rubripirellula reticaptiva]|uniref:Uncharacterized protein n=1 Tax=Rubripirellula reticaptiva TaxID=2528013 RepID=A0A5C6EIR4_9BACT|nr:hypothetical protein [Rubripirellula reticaptiva]TWU47977.1 hypothetical protein Poly59_48210 [Rubripirellula reticaptiva]